MEVQLKAWQHKMGMGAVCMHKAQTKIMGNVWLVYCLFTGCLPCLSLHFKPSCTFSWFSVWCTQSWMLAPLKSNSYMGVYSVAEHRYIHNTYTTLCSCIRQCKDLVHVDKQEYSIYLVCGWYSRWAFQNLHVGGCLWNYLYRHTQQWHPFKASITMFLTP